MSRNALTVLLLFITTTIFSQYNITGTVTDLDNNFLVGASVWIKELDRGTITDKSGSFKFEGLKKGEYTLHISFMGFETVKSILEVNGNISQVYQLQPAIFRGEEIIVRATRASENTPTTYSTVDKEQIEQQNLGQDLPYLLSMEPSLVYTSDAGAGVGYTSMWIRGSNIQRINVTVNGIPLNDPESHGVFWVDLPDIASSVQSIQIQRGVGTSTNGGGAFGATMNLETDYISRDVYGHLSSSYGSFNTWKNTIRLGTGLIKDKWAFEGRASSITSDGYIDRASSNLKSFFLQGGYFGKSTVVKALAFGGKEKTYQAWYGIDKETLENDRTFNWAGAIYDENWNITGFYDNETDNYQQDHYQVHLSQMVTSRWHFNTSLHYTYGRGYYEQYFSNEYLGNYPIGVQYFGYDSTFSGGDYQYFYHDTISYGDIVVRQWLDNQFYGTTFALNYNTIPLQFTFGGALNNYANAKHYGEIIWAEYAGDTRPEEKYYTNTSNKSDITFYSKLDIKLSGKLGIFIDLQTRNVSYTGSGTDTGRDTVAIDEKYFFLNPKAGITCIIEPLGTLYASYAVSSREPIRTDFLDAPEGITPKPERLQDMEAGFRNEGKRFSYSLNGYLMLYTNQLVLTGAINDVGSPIRANVGRSYRLGAEADAVIILNKYVSARTNLAVSRNKTDYKRIEGEEIVEYNDVPLTFSPALIGGFQFIMDPLKTVEITLNGKYVDRQFLDLTGNVQKSIDPYFINNLMIAWSIPSKSLQECRLSLQINNLFNIKYVSNGYVWDDVPYFYPQAGIHVMGGIDMQF